VRTVLCVLLIVAGSDAHIQERK